LTRLPTDYGHGATWQAFHGNSVLASAQQCVFGDPTQCASISQLRRVQVAWHDASSASMQQNSAPGHFASTKSHGVE